MSPAGRRAPRRSRREIAAPSDRPGCRALLSVADKDGLVPFARGLAKPRTRSSRPAARQRRCAPPDPVIEVAAITGFPEIMDGRVKTLHPHIHGGLLARRGVDEGVLFEHGIGVIDLLAVNLYPFEATTARPDCTDAEAIENIDIGGPAMLRAAAKNHEQITVVVDPADYAPCSRRSTRARFRRAIRRDLAIKAFVIPRATTRRSATTCARTRLARRRGPIRCS